MREIRTSGSTRGQQGALRCPLSYSTGPVLYSAARSEVLEPDNR